ncbi:MAG: cupin domain-containing protein [Kofleriaceae bacterium]|nr:cupin domain-containing protein [Kofleriaceae bacterium]
MSNWTTRVACVLLAVAPAAYADKTAATKSATNTKQNEPVALNPSELKWTAGPPDLPKGVQMAVLHGDPTKAGNFTVRLKMPDGYKIPAHWHSQEEQLTILGGKLDLHMGDTMDAPGHTLETGGYHFLPANTHHVAQAKGETIVQIYGTGPFDIRYTNPADNPNPKNARR